MRTILTTARTNAEPLAAQSLSEFRETSQLLNFAHGENDVRNAQCLASAPKRILVPLPLSSGSYAALAIAKNLAREFNAKLVLLHVVQLNIAGEELGIPRTRIVKEMCRNAELQLQELAIGMCGQITTEVLVCEGRPAEAIVQAAKRLKADTIVMYTQGHCGWLKWLHRNTALKVVRQAPCGILLVTPTKCDTAINLITVDHSRINQQSEHMEFHKTQNWFRSIFRTLFS
jgi:nucleotide-binding universal stress UspA family protein